ncbi:porin [Methylocapsa sp. S129]|uniref:porin n=1 Tax=Methylocapsa sp. S129 TaxID=1641869 RepID=UPI001AED6D83|nr:porin [Methylocapsa sp. S129]
MMMSARGTLLSSAACIVGAAASHAADLPTRKSAPAEYVKICNVGGMAGFVIPGSDTCLKIGGYVSAQVEAGNLKKGYSWSPGGQGTALISSPASLRSSFGWTTRAELDLDIRQQTSYGVLRGYTQIRFENGNGFDTDGTGAYIDVAYLQWAGITAGKTASFFGFFGGGYGWANIFSPAQAEGGSNEPDVLAYTATFGGGFSATASIQSPGANSFSATGLTNNGSSGGGANFNINTTNYGMTFPDFVANIRVDQSWGSAQLSGVAHQVHVYDAVGNSLDKWGWGILGGASFNLPTLGAGDKLSIDGVYTRNAIWYSGIPEGLWGENGAANGNGLAMSAGDTYSVGGGRWATPSAWSAAALYEHHFSAAFSIDPEISYAQLNWSGSMGQLSSNSQSWIVGGVAHWDPAPLLDFAFELLYENTHQSTPSLYTPTVGTIDGKLSPFPNNTDGFAGRFYITRNF